MFTNLAPGESVFRVKCANDAGIWTDREPAPMMNSKAPVTLGGTSTSVNRRGVMRRVDATVASAAFLIASLLTFPGAVAWMTGGWILGQTCLVLRRRPGWVPLVACLTILLVKRDNHDHIRRAKVDERRIMLPLGLKIKDLRVNLMQLLREEETTSSENS